jgi:hypothetical protein
MTGKWNIGSVHVNGQAMFGDNNQMHVNLGSLNVADPAAVRAALAQISNSIEGAAQPADAELSSEQKAEVQQAVHEVIDELKKPQESQNPGLLKKCLDQVMQVAAAVPPVITAALQLKGVLGL